MKTASFLELLKSIKSRVDQRIFEFLPESHNIPEIDLLYKMMRDYPSRAGKGLRPGLLMIFNRAFGGRDDMALTTAAALELFQNWIVIHDDIEDQSDLRRGLPALHLKHGVPLALNAGDALAGKMWELLLVNREIIGPEKTIKILDEFLNMYSRTTAGQHIELGWVSTRKWDLTENDYFEMCRSKTAWYTVITPAWTGAHIAGADYSARDNFVKFGLDLGVAFQIQDDVLNLAGDLSKYGKEIGGDIREGKRTLVTIDLLRKCSPDERKSLIDILNKEREKKSQADVDQVLALIDHYDCIDYAVHVSQKLAERARMTFIESIDGSADPEYRQIILDIIDFMVSREL
jgi:geranylgeranyl diphosphate synthase type II